MSVKAVDKCRICGSEDFISVLDLGSQLLSSVTITEENKNRIPNERIPLEVIRCKGECGLVQLRHTYPSDNIYREYWYRSGVNQTMRDALKSVVESALKLVDLSEGDVVVDIGCNDGTLLNNYDEKLNRIGFDPVENIRGENETFNRIVDYFNAPKLADVSGGKRAKVITSIAMFYDLEDPNQFVSDISRSLDDNGIWIVQMADLPEMVKNNMFDQIIHEHLEYYHIEPFKYLVEKHGLKIVNMVKNDVNGSSYRFYVRKKEGADPSAVALNTINAFMDEEKKLGLGDNKIYEEFRKGSEKIREDLVAFVKKTNEDGKMIINYGASTKGNVILQYCGFTEKDIPYASDRNPRKWGGWCIGSNIPIISEEEARKMKPDYMLVLPYYFLKEMLPREREYLEGGGKFIVPVPSVHVVDKSALI